MGADRARRAGRLDHLDGAPDGRRARGDDRWPAARATLFADWYSVVSPLAQLAGEQGSGSHSGWQAHPLLRWPLLVMAVAPFILAYVVVRDHQLSWARGELTAVLSIFACGLLLYVGVIDRPGEPAGQIELAAPWYVALLGTLLMLAGSARRTGETERRRTPPGTI